jgi:hypothetical protein
MRGATGQNCERAGQPGKKMLAVIPIGTAKGAWNAIWVCSRYRTTYRYLKLVGSTYTRNSGLHPSSTILHFGKDPQLSSCSGRHFGGSGRLANETIQNYWSSVLIGYFLQQLSLWAPPRQRTVRHWTFSGDPR